MTPEEQLDFSIKESIRLQKYQDVREHLVPLISNEIGRALTPYIDKIDSAVGRLAEAVVNISVAAPIVNVPDVNVPEIKLPTITIPEIKLPDITVNVPEVKLPTINVPEPKVTVNVPETKFPDYPAFPDFPTEMGLRGVGLETPLSVQLRDSDGRAFTFPVQISSAGGKADHFTIKGFDQSAYADYVNPDGRFKVSTETDLDIRDLDYTTDDVSVYQVSGAIWSVAVPGTVAVTQSGTWTVQPGNTQNTTPWLVEETNSFLNITAATSSTVVKSGAGILHTLTINKRGTGSVCDMYADLVGEGSKIGSIDTTLSTTAFLYDIAFTSGLTIVTTGASGADLTISYT